MHTFRAPDAIIVLNEDVQAKNQDMTEAVQTKEQDMKEMIKHLQDQIDSMKSRIVEGIKQKFAK